MDIKYLKGVGDKRAEAFNKTGINSITDFLNLIPRIYLKRVDIRNIPSFKNENVLIYGRIIEIIHPRKSHHPLTVWINDGTASTEIPVFGKSEFRSKQFRLGDSFLFWGKVDEGYFNTKVRLDYRDHLKLDENDPSDKNFLKYAYLPVYELQGELKKTWIRPLLLSKIVFNAFSVLINKQPEVFAETVPGEITERYGFMSRRDAVLRINFPFNFDEIEDARKRLAYDELFYLQVIMALRKRNIKKENNGIAFDKNIETYLKGFTVSLPFELTGAQIRVMNEIYENMKLPNVMNRLLQGDVGSGKTIVAIYAMLIAAGNGYQSAFMCPTELLAEQHFLTVKSFTKNLGINVSLLVGGQKKKEREHILENIKSGETNIVVGTHALIQEKVEFKNLGLAVIDEQHKFGVMQRAKIKEKGSNPDVLVMTATPIPRTLSLTVYGDLDVSVIDEMPKSRKKIITAIRGEDDKPKVFDFLREEIKNGRQAYIVYPIIEESEKLDLKSAEESYKHLKESVFKDLNVGMIHGRIHSLEKDEEMEKFKNGETNILVATTVIEVGIDIPNATIMIIEEAHRFGLSQMHQLRGRIGRGAEQSYCILIAKELDLNSRKRLNIMSQTTDGFKIAEADMDIRGPGEFFGIRQSGALNFTCTDLSKDKALAEAARSDAFKIINEDPQLRNEKHLMIRSKFMKDYKDSLYLMNVA